MTIPRRGGVLHATFGRIARRASAQSLRSSHPTLPSRTTSIAPAAFPRPGSFLLFSPSSRPPLTEEWRNAERRTALECRAGKARRHACEAWAPPGAAGGPPLGAPPWRVGPFPPFHSRRCRRVRREATRHQALVPGRGSGPAVAVTSRDDASRSAFRIASRKRPSRAGFAVYSSSSRRSQ